MKREIWIGSFVLKYFGIVITFVALFSSCTKDENIQTQPPTTEWKTVFFDDFNRENTANGDLGSNWIVCDTTNVSIMQIINNEVHAEREVPALYEPDICPYALYIQDVNCQSFGKTKISVKMRTDSGSNYPVFILFAGADSILNDEYSGFLGYDGEGCFIGYDGEAFISYRPNVQNIYPYEISANTTYMLEMTVDSKEYKHKIYDFATGRLLDYGGTTDEVLVSGKVGFMVGARSPNAVFVDDFKIEIQE